MTRTARWTCRTAVLVVAALAATFAPAAAQEANFQFDQAQIPRFNVPRMTKPPTIDGTIGADEWRQAAKIMGVAWTGSLDFRDRPVSFWIAWDPGHLYLAVRTDILPGHRLWRQYRERYASAVVHDDSIELGLFLHDRNRLPNEVSSFLKIVLNSLGSGEYMKLYPAIGQNLFNWRPDMKVANRIYEEGGRQWWDMEIAASLADLQMPVEHKAGDEIGMLLAADLKNPEWQWLDVPSATGHLQHYGFPRATLTAEQPYVQVERLAGLHDEKLDLLSAIYNPTAKPVKVKAVVRVLHGPAGAKGLRGLPAPDKATALVSEEKSLTIAPGESARMDVTKAFAGQSYKDASKDGPGELSAYEYQVTLADDPAAKPVYTSSLTFRGTNKDYLKAVPRLTKLEYGMEYNPVLGLLHLSADTLDAAIPAGTTAAGATYRVTRDGQAVKEGRLPNLAHYKYDDLVALPALAAGEYRVRLALMDAGGKELVARDDIHFGKKDEAKEFAAWWGNRIGETEKVLPPFEPLVVGRGEAGGAAGGTTTIAAARRVYELDGLGLPAQIQANGGPVLAGPVRIVLTAGGQEHVVPVAGGLKITSAKDWRVEFEGRPATAAGWTFSSRGTMEQDGLVELDLTFAPEGAQPPAAIEALRVEWPVDDSLGLHVACIGEGGNYSARSIGKVPAGTGEVWSTLRNIGLTGTGMTRGSFTGNVWLGTEVRGLLWASDTDRGWDVDDKVTAHSLVRAGGAVVLRNNLIGTYEGKKPPAVTAARTVHLGYNATPFRKLASGWRLNQVSAANGFAEKPKYKWNWDTGQEYFSVLSPPFPDTRRWPEYYAHCKQTAEQRGRMGIYSIGPRLGPYLTNQIALRGYMDKTLEPGVYEYFAGDWRPGKEALSATYTDYMTWLMDRQVREGGCTHFYFDITFAGATYRDLAAGLGYRLDDGRIQPELGDGNLRRWYRRVWSMMSAAGVQPGGISGHSTNGICLKALPWSDAILDSEYPMKDPIDVYPSERMIGMSCPHAYGVNICHLGFMNPVWPAMHDAGTGGEAVVFGHADFRHWGITRDDVQFVPYWRNAAVVKELTAGTLVSLWKRPGSAVLGILNHGPDAEGAEKSRPVRVKLDLAALGVPAAAVAAAAGERVRASQFADLPAQQRYVGHLKWYQDLPGEARTESKPVPPIQPHLDAATGVLDGFDLRYHDVRFVVIHWDDQPADPAAEWAKLIPADLRPAVLDWGITAKDTQPLTGDALTAAVKAEAPPAESKLPIRVYVWKRPGTILLRMENLTDKPVRSALHLDLAALGVKVDPVKELWHRFTQIYDFQHLTWSPWERGVQAGIWETDAAALQAAQRPGRVVFDAWNSRLAVHLAPGQVRCVSIDTN